MAADPSARAQPAMASSPPRARPLAKAPPSDRGRALPRGPRAKLPVPTDTAENRHLFSDHIYLCLLLVSRQMYHAARLLPFQSNTFIFTKTYGSSVISAIKLLQKLLDWQRQALRSVEIAAVGREIVECWRREAGWEAAVHLPSSSKVEVRVRIQGDVWIGDGAGGYCWLVALWRTCGTVCGHWMGSIKGDSGTGEYGVGRREACCWDWERGVGA